MAGRLARQGGVWFEEVFKARRILATPRIGVDYAGPSWAGRRLRFLALGFDPVISLPE
jgi:3-methyladenine DNA glycosylase Mpg